MTPDGGVLDRKAVEQLQRLREVARGHSHFVPVGAQQLDDGAHDKHVRAVGEVDPDTHRWSTLAPARAGAASLAGGRAEALVLRGLRCGSRRANDRYRCGHMAHVLVLASISESLVNSISHFVRDAGLPGIFALMAISSACIPIPSEVVMLFAGFAVADPTQSAAHHHMTMTGVVLAGLLGTMVGSWIAYGIGRGGRLELFERHGAKLHMGPAQIQRADRFFQRYGEQTVLFGRMVPLVRAFVSLPAGVSRMPLGRFTLFSLLGTIPWVLALAFAGHALGSDWTTVRKGFEYLDYAIVLLIVAGIVYAVVRRRSRGPAQRPRRASPRPTSVDQRRDAGLRARAAAASRRGPRPACTAPPSCCRSPPRRTQRSSLGWQAGRMTSSTQGCASPSRWRCTRVQRQLCCCAHRRGPSQAPTAVRRRSRLTTTVDSERPPRRHLAQDSAF